MSLDGGAPIALEAAGGWMHRGRATLTPGVHEVVVGLVLASCGPYDLLLGAAAAPGFGGEEEEWVGLDEVGYVASFEFTPDALDAAAAVIFGEEEARGRAPVCGGNIFP